MTRTARRRSSFTLVEMVAVLVILSLAAAAVTLRLEGPVARATAGDLTGRIAALDRLTRVAARRHDRALVVEFDLGAGSVRRFDAERREQRGTALDLPRSWRLAQVVVAGGGSGGASGGAQEASAGRVLVAFSRRGLSPTYALCIEGPGGGEGAWLVAAGLTGEVTQVENEKEVKAIFAALAGRPDAR
jgi:type II secretory pathway pseudopilin PulG